MFVRIGICVSFLAICFLGDIDLDLNDIELNPDTDDLSQVLPGVSGRKYTKLLIGVKLGTLKKIFFYLIQETFGS